MTIYKSVVSSIILIFIRLLAGHATKSGTLSSRDTRTQVRITKSVASSIILIFIRLLAGYAINSDMLYSRVTSNAGENN